MAIIEPINVTTRNGLNVTVRSALPADAKAFNTFMRESFAQSEMLIRRPEEYAVGPREERKRLKGYLTAERDVAMIAVHDGAIIGVLNTNSEKRRRAAHNVELGIAVADGWQGHGLGRKMMEILISWAEKAPAIRRLELHVLASNTHAIRLYEALGFEIEGRRDSAVRLDSGRYVDDLFMRRWVLGAGAVSNQMNIRA